MIRMFTKIIVLELDFLKEAPIFPHQFFFSPDYLELFIHLKMVILQVNLVLIDIYGRSGYLIHITHKVYMNKWFYTNIFSTKKFVKLRGSIGSD